MIGHREDRSYLISGLRAVADFYETHPEAYYDGTSVSLMMYVSSARARNVLAAMAQAFGEYEESYDEKYAVVARRFGEKVKVELFAPRSRVSQCDVVGVRVEPALVIAGTREIRIPERVVQVVEWSCSPLLSGRDASHPSGLLP